MAFASGPVSFQRFFVTGPLPDEVTDRLVAALQRRAFGHSPPLPDDTQVGWVGPRHLMDVELRPDDIACGPYVHLALRLDRLRAPSSVLRAYAGLEEEAALKASGREVLGKTEQRRARAAARDRADREAREGAFRRSTAFPVLIDLSQKTALLGTTSPGAADKFMQLFHESLGCGLEPADAQNVAGRIMDRSRNARALEALAPFTLVPPPDGVDDVGPRADGDLAFLGKELLTWLWFRTDADDGPLQVRTGGGGQARAGDAGRSHAGGADRSRSAGAVQVPAADGVTVMLDRTLRLRCDFGLTGTTAITADNPTRLPEAKAALRIGKQPLRAGLVLGAPGGELRLTLDGPRLAISGLVVPDPPAEEDARARLERRFEQVGDAAALIEALFELFLLRRVARDWERELAAMSAWATGRAAGRAARVASA